MGSSPSRNAPLKVNVVGRGPMVKPINVNAQATHKHVQSSSDDKLSLMFTKFRADAEKMVSQLSGRIEDVAKVLGSCNNIMQLALQNKNKLEEFADLLVSIGFIKPVCKIAVDTLKNWKKDVHVRVVAVQTLCVVWSASDASTEVRRQLANYPMFLETMRTIISSYDSRNQIVIRPDISDFRVLKASISIVSNTSRCQDTIARLRQLDFISVCKPYLYTPDRDLNLSDLGLLANLVKEEECHIISAAKNCVEYLLSNLKSALEAVNNRRSVHGSWSVIECGGIIRNLARNDANKRMMGELGALPLLVKMGRSGNKEEQYESLNAIWALCFDTENQTKVVKEKDLGVVEFLMDTKKNTTVDSNIKRVCHGALWTIRNAMKMSDNKVYKDYAIAMESELQPTKPQISNKKDEGVKAKLDDVGHVMISYNWADKELLKTIRDILKAKGFKVWIDIDQMGGSTLESMANAIEQSEVVLMCMSQKYKNSHNCRNEAEYAFEKKKTIIPLKTELGYKPDGWLGFICGSKLFYDFSGKYDFEDKITELVHAIQKQYEGCNSSGLHLSEKPETNAKSVPVNVQQVGNNATPNATTQSGFKTPAFQAVKHWSESDVQAWKQKHDLQKILSPKITAGEIALLLRMKKESADYFYKCADELLEVKGVLHLSKLIWALDEINP